MNEVDNIAGAHNWPENLGEWQNGVRAQFETALTALVERTVKIAAEPLEPLSAGDIDQVFPQGLVRVTIPLEAGGAWHFIISPPLVGALAALAEQESEKTEYDPERHDPAIGAIIVQIVSMLESDLESIYGTGIELGEPDVGLSPEQYTHRMAGQPSVLWRVDVEGWGEGLILEVLELPQAESAEDTVGDDAAESAPETELEDAEIPGESLHSPASGSGAFPDMENDASASTRDNRGPSPVAKPATFEEFHEGQEPPKPSNGKPRNLDMLLDINLPISIELGRTNMLIRDVLELGPGSVIELDKVSGEPVDLYVNNKKFAKGEVVVIEENFGIRITEVLQVNERLLTLK